MYKRSIAAILVSTALMMSALNASINELEPDNRKHEEQSSPALAHLHSRHCR